MNLQEFAALAVGDKIENNAFGQSGEGEVVAVEASGVRVVWGPVTPNATRFFYSVQSTAWMHWSRPDDEEHMPASLGDAQERKP